MEILFCHPQTFGYFTPTVPCGLNISLPRPVCDTLSIVLLSRNCIAVLNTNLAAASPPTTTSLISLPHFQKQTRIHPPPVANTSLAACGPSHLPSVLTAPRLTQYPHSLAHTGPHLGLHSISRLSLHSRHANAHAHTHTSTQTLLLSAYPSILEPSIHPAVFADAITADWFNCDFPEAPSQNTSAKITEEINKYLLTTGTHLSWLHWIDSLICSILSQKRGEGEKCETEGQGERVGRRKELREREKENGLIKSLSADVSLQRQEVCGDWSIWRSWCRWKKINRLTCLLRVPSLTEQRLKKGSKQKNSANSALK